MDHKHSLIPMFVGLAVLSAVILGQRALAQIAGETTETMQVIDWTLIEQPTDQPHIRKGTLYLTTRQSSSMAVASQSTGVSAVRERVLSLIINKKHEGEDK